MQTVQTFKAVFKKRKLIFHLLQNCVQKLFIIFIRQLLFSQLRIDNLCLSETLQNISKNFLGFSPPANFPGAVTRSRKSSNFCSNIICEDEFCADGDLAPLTPGGCCPDSRLVLQTIHRFSQ